MTVNKAFVIAAMILFILAALIAFFSLATGTFSPLALVATGLASFMAALL